jgi:hypothetical protein
MTAEIAGLVDTERGMISRRISIESEITKRNFGRPLRAVGCSSDSAGTVGAFLNVCRHRGNRLCGRGLRIRCKHVTSSPTLKSRPAGRKRN